MTRATRTLARSAHTTAMCLAVAAGWATEANAGASSMTAAPVSEEESELDEVPLAPATCDSKSVSCNPAVTKHTV